jgi:tetratricopeptide (TPR) repeat protein
MRSAGWELLVLLSSLTLLAPAPAVAHGAIHEQIAEVTQQISQDSSNARLYVRRGELQSEHGDWKAALGDYDRAGQLNPDLIIIDLARGRTLFNLGQYDSAKEALDRFLVGEPRHAEAWILRARTLAQLGQLDASVADYTYAIAHVARLGHPIPDYYMERARLTAARGRDHVLVALRGLDEGMAALGPLVTFQLYAIELELSVGRTEAALARLDSVAAQQAHRPEVWLARRGEILEYAGRTDNARAAYEQALAAIDALPPRHRKTRATLELETRLRRALAPLQR